MGRLAKPMLLLIAVAACSRPDAAPPPHQIRVVGGAAGFPIAAAIAERFMTEVPDAIAPLVQAGGDASGIARFCGGPGARYPDLAMVTREPTPAERALCTRNGVARMAAIPIGWTATVVAARPPLVVAKLTSAQLHTLITGPARSWRDVSADWPAEPIRLQGVLDTPAGVQPRRDGALRGNGADAALAASEAARMPGTLAILPYAAWWHRRDDLVALPLDGVRPDAAAIANGRYPGARRLLLLAKPGAVRAVPGLATMLRMIAETPAGRDAALVPLAASERAASRCALYDLANAPRPSDCNIRTAQPRKDSHVAARSPSPAGR